jgi:hypothetical protein
MKIEILHTRDPDYECGITLWIDGVQIKDADIHQEDVDPGRGYMRSDWDERIANAQQQGDESPAFHDAVLEATNAASTSPFITEER